MAEYRVDLLWSGVIFLSSLIHDFLFYFSIECRWQGCWGDRVIWPSTPCKYCYLFL